MGLYAAMTRDKQLRNRKGRNGGFRSYRHAYTMAQQQHKREFFMTHRQMRRYWDEPHGELYGPLCLMSRWLQRKMRSNVEFRRGEALACNAGLGVEHPGKD